MLGENEVAVSFIFTFWFLDVEVFTKRNIDLFRFNFQIDLSFLNTVEFPNLCIKTDCVHSKATKISDWDL